jgi:ATP-dependent Clp endopeptidase proteolytic subunit ClpP
MHKTARQAFLTKMKAERKDKGYKFQNLNSDRPEVYIYDEIGAWGITALDFVNELQSLKAEAFDLHISSPGGEVFDGLAIYNAILSHKADVTVYVDGLAASAASFIAMAGNKVVIAKNAEMMIHDAMGLVIGNASDMAEMITTLDRLSDNIASIYADKAGGTADQWRSLMKEERWYNAQEAVESGLADEVQGKPSESEPTDSVAYTLFKHSSREEAEPTSASSTDGNEEDEFAWLSKVDLTSTLSNALKEAS